LKIQWIAVLAILLSNQSFADDGSEESGAKMDEATTSADSETKTKSDSDSSATVAEGAEESKSDLIIQTKGDYQLIINAKTGIIVEKRKIGNSEEGVSDSEKSDPTRKPIEYTCKEGKKTFNTKIIVEDSDYGTNVAGDIAVDVEGEIKTVPISFRLFFGEVLIGEGKSEFNVGTVEGQSENETQAQYDLRQSAQERAIAKVAKLGTLKEGHFEVDSKLEVKSGSCIAELPVTVLVNKNHIKNIENRLRKNEVFEKHYSTCEKEVNSNAFQSLYAQMMICSLQTCESSVKEIMATENRAGSRSGYVNKVKLAAGGYYLESSTQAKSKFGRIAKDHGGSAECPKGMLSSRDTAQVYGSGGDAFVCVAPVNYSAEKLSACAKSAIGYDEESKKIGYFNPTFAMYRLAGNKFSFALDEYAQNAAENESKSRAPASADASEEDPDVVAKKQDTEEVQEVSKPWMVRLK
jgi:hypothetical protein